MGVGAAVAGGLAAGAAAGVAGGLLGGGGPKRNIKAEELVLEGDRLGLGASQTQQDLLRLLIGGQWNPGSISVKGQDITGLFSQQPTGPAFNLVQGGLFGEEDLGQQRLQIAQQLLQNFDIDADQARQFSQQQLGVGGQALQGQEDFLTQQQGQFGQNAALQQQIGGDLGQFFSSGGAPNSFQQQTIGDIFNAQRQIGQSNLNQQFQDFARILDEELAPARGLRGSDTPIQRLGERTMQEFLRNSANLEASIGGNQSQALLQQPFAQAGLGSSLLNQLQTQNLNTLNAFSVPIGQGFNQQNFVNQLGQFGLQFSPAAQAGPALSNFGALLGQGNFAQPTTAFSANIAPTAAPGFAQNFSSNFGSSLGQAFGSGIAGSVGNLATPNTTNTPPSSGATPKSTIYGTF